MAQALNLKGKRFGKLHVIDKSIERRNGFICWQVICDCGNKVVVIGSSLAQGKSKSCGCVIRKHDMSRTKIYGVWAGMKARCYNKNNPKYKDYGKRGITVCDEWLHSFDTFYADMGDTPSPLYSIDRINNNESYHKNNCKWSDRTQQKINQRINIRNTSGIVGVCMDRSVNKWHATITKYKVKKHLGFFTDFFEACSARKSAELQFFNI